MVSSSVISLLQLRHGGFQRLAREVNQAVADEHRHAAGAADLQDDVEVELGERRRGWAPPPRRWTALQEPYRISFAGGWVVRVRRPQAAFRPLERPPDPRCWKNWTAILVCPLTAVFLAMAMSFTGFASAVRLA